MLEFNKGCKVQRLKRSFEGYKILDELLLWLPVPKLEWRIVYTIMQTTTKISLHVTNLQNRHLQILKALLLIYYSGIFLATTPSNHLYSNGK